MIASVYFLYVLFAVATLALIINVRFRLPKKVFGFLAVLILVTTCWIAMNPPKEIPSPLLHSRSVLTRIIAENVVLNTGENCFPLSFEDLVPSCVGVSYLLEFEVGQGEESLNYSDYSLTLHASEESYLDCSALSFTGNTLRCVFVFPKEFDIRKISFLKLVCKSDANLNLRIILEEKID